jgi:hypothetical protein
VSELVFQFRDAVGQQNQVIQATHGSLLKSLRPFP